MDNKFISFLPFFDCHVNRRQFTNNPKTISVISLLYWRPSQISPRIVVPIPIAHFKFRRTASQIVTVLISSQVVAYQSVCFPLGNANRLHELVRLIYSTSPGPSNARSIGARSSLPNMRKFGEYPVSSWT